MHKNFDRQIEIIYMTPDGRIIKRTIRVLDVRDGIMRA